MFFNFWWHRHSCLCLADKNVYPTQKCKEFAYNDLYNEVDFVHEGICNGGGASDRKFVLNFSGTH